MTSSQVSDIEISDTEIEPILLLLERDDDDVLSYLGIQAERFETDERRAASGRAVPEWSTQDAISKVLSPQRASVDELSRYAKKGLAFAENLLQRGGAQLRTVLCDGNAVRKELLDLESDTKALIRGVASAILAVVLTGVPTLLAKAAVSIATTLAVVLLKGRLQVFCAVGRAALTTQSR